MRIWVNEEMKDLKRSLETKLQEEKLPTKKEELYCNIQKPSRDIIMDKIFLVYVNENIFQWEILEIFHLK